jgi:hypothetical protein
MLKRGSTIEPSPRDFTWPGVPLGLPSLPALLYFLLALVGLHPTSPTRDASGKTDYNSLVGLLMGGAQLAGTALKWFMNDAQWAIGWLAVLSLLLLVVAIALYRYWKRAPCTSDVG